MPATDMLAWENSGFSVDASVRITLSNRDVPSYFQSLEPPVSSARGPPADWGEFVQIHDNRDVFQATDRLFWPSIDIHSL